MIRILLGHRETLTRGALSVVLDREDDLAVVAEVAHRDELPSSVRRHQADMAVLDLGLPGETAIGVLCEQLVPDCTVLLIAERKPSTWGQVDLAGLAPHLGLVATECSPDDLVTGVRQLSRGEPVLDAGLALTALTTTNNPLTSRERQVLQLVAQGLSSKEIAHCLHLTSGTVRNIHSRTMTKLGVRSRIEAISIAQKFGWI